MDTANGCDQQLNNNLQILSDELCSLLDGNGSKWDASCSRSQKNGGRSVLQELNREFDGLKLNSNTPEFEFHGFGCAETSNLLCKGILNAANNGGKKNKSNSTASAQGNLIWHGKQHPQKENIWNQIEDEMINTQNIKKNITQKENCNEEMAVINLMELFKSLHQHVNADLPSNQLNTMPSDYTFELAQKNSMPMGFNMHHHVQVLHSKIERFVQRQRRILETNRQFDYIRYTKCLDLLNEIFRLMQALKMFSKMELRQRGMLFINRHAKVNGRNLEFVLKQLRELLKFAHIEVFVFNWEMDHEHRYSAAMKQRNDATNQKALELAIAQLRGSQQRPLNQEEQLITDRYQMANIIHCVKEHEDFMQTMLKAPETYFPPEIVALCDPPPNGHHLPLATNVALEAAIDNTEEFGFDNNFLDLAPSSPPRVNPRRRVPKCNRA